MKYFIYLLVIISIIALAGLFVLKQPNGQTWLSVDSVFPPTQVINDSINVVTKKLNDIFEKGIPEKNSTVKVYRWKDSNGNWSYSDKPEESIENEEVILDQNNIIVLPAFDVSTIDLPNANPKEKQNNTLPNTLIPTPDKILKLYQDANNIQNLMDSRQQNISKAIKDSAG